MVTLPDQEKFAGADQITIISIGNAMPCRKISADNHTHQSLLRGRLLGKNVRINNIIYVIGRMKNSISKDKK